MKFQVFDVDYVLDKKNKPIVRLFGRIENGKSICCFVPGAEPYFYAELINGSDIKKIKNEIIKRFKQVIKIDIVERFRPLGYQEDKLEMLKIIVLSPSNVKDIRYDVGKIDNIVDVHEADILFKNRFIVDRGISPMGWVDINEEGDDNKLVSKYIVNGVATDIVAISKNIKVIDKDINVDMKYVTFDIETMTDGETFPEPDKNEILMISAYFEPKLIMKNGTETDNLVFVSKYVDVENTICYENEISMLNGFFNVIREYDFDLIAGYNSHGFDVPYIVGRIKKLRKDGYKIDDSISRDKKPLKYSKFGESHSVKIGGRISIDMLPVVRESEKLSQYDLGTVAREVLGMKKLDVDVARISEYWNGGKDKLEKLINYARVDSELVMKMIIDKKMLVKKSSLAMLSGTVTQDVFGAGQTVMIENLLLKRFNEAGRVVASKPSEEEKSRRESHASELAGGEVLDLEKVGLVEDVVILDYKSLYPTIMISSNLCFSTEIFDVGKELESHAPPSGGNFVKQHIYKGIIPTILEELLAERMLIKKQMKLLDSDSSKYELLDARQYGIKILLNSFYGYTGYIRSRMYSLVVANAVTSTGRKNILITRNYIDNEINSVYVSNENVVISTHGNNIEITELQKITMKHVDVKVTYGDTDSVFVIFNSLDNKKLTKDEYKNVASEIARIATTRLPSPMELEFESYCKRGIMLAKKRYALYIYELEFGGWKSKMKIKGIETVRRDWCNVVTETLKNTLDIILIEGDVDKSIEYVKGTLDSIQSIDISNDDELFNKLILTKKFTKSPDQYKNIQPHLSVIEKMKNRGIDKYRIGDRIPFVIITGREKMTLRAEDPDYARINNLALDMKYYTNKQLMSPMKRVFVSILGDEFNKKWDYMHGITPNNTIFDVINNESNKITQMDNSTNGSINESNEIIKQLKKGNKQRSLFNL